MINQNILRKIEVRVGMKRMGKTVRTGAVFNQRDTKTAILMCTIIFNGNVDLTGCYISANILKSDGTKVVQAGQIVDAKNGLVAIGLTEQCLSAIGEVICELSIQSDNQVLYSPQMTFNVVDNLFDLEDDEIISTDEYPILNALIAEVQNMESALLALDAIVKGNEENRQENEDDRQESIEKIKSDFSNIVDDYAEKVAFINSELIKLNTNVDNKIEETNEKISEVNELIEYTNTVVQNNISAFNSKMAEVNALVSDKLIYVDNFISAKNDLVDNKIKEINQKISEYGEDITEKFDYINSTLNGKVDEVNTKLTEADEFLIEKSNQVDSKFDDKVGAVDLIINNKLNSVDSDMENYRDSFNTKVSEVDSKLIESTNKISEMDSTIDDNVNIVSNKMADVNRNMSEINTTVNVKVQLVDSKIEEVDTVVANKVGEMSSLIEDVELAESLRDQSEQERATTYSNLISEFTITQADLDDILDMIGGI